MDENCTLGDKERHKEDDGLGVIRGMRKAFLVLGGIAAIVVIGIVVL